MNVTDDVLIAVLDGISNDGFLAFVDRFLSQFNGLIWGSHTEFSIAHLNAHKQYAALFESRVHSLLRKNGISEEDFARRCQVLIYDANLGDVKRVDGPDEASPANVASTLLDMMEHVAAFPSFVAMMAARTQDDV